MEHLLQLREQNVPKWDHLLGGPTSFPPTGSNRTGESGRSENDRPPKSSRPGREFSPIGAKKTPFESKKHHVQLSHIKPIEKKSCMWLMWICGCNESDTGEPDRQSSWQTVSQAQFFVFLRWINLRWIEMHWSKCFFSLIFFSACAIPLYYYTIEITPNSKWHLMFCRLTCHRKKNCVVYWYNSPLHRWRSKCRCNFVSQGHQENRRFTFPRFVVSSFRLYRLPFCLRTREACLISMTWRSGEQLFQLLGCQEAGEYSDIWFLWLWQWHVKSWLGSKIAHDMSKNKSVAWRVGSFTKFDRRNHKRLLQRRLPPSQNKMNLRDFRKWLIKNMFFLWFYTPPETNMESESHPSEKEFHLPNLQRFHVSFLGCRESS